MAGDTAAKLAVLIDADNAQPTIVEALLAEVAAYGTAHVKRAYGDWTGTTLKGWKAQLLAQSIQPIQQFAYTTGKNATDAALVIDAMDLRYTDRFDGFCLVSSDSDFTRLAARIRESDRVRLRRTQDTQALRRGLRQVSSTWTTSPPPPPPPPPRSPAQPPRRLRAPRLRGSRATPHW
ncbi:NYN domain-containing protein [Nonomuraea endophytica]|uniref:NYN domain-containing protein n=1 Tax=Nonomuraea endophytica TaxID=714136 RepID=UPI0037C9AA81